MDVIIPFIGWALASTVHKLFSTLQQQLMVFLNHCGELKLGTPQSQITTTVLQLIESALKFIQTSLQVGTRSQQRKSLVIFMEART